MTTLIMLKAAIAVRLTLVALVEPFAPSYQELPKAARVGIQDPGY